MNTSLSAGQPAAGDGAAPLECFPVPAFRDNYIWLVSDGRQALVVDPGEARPVIAALRAGGIQLGAILLTHHHADHVGGVGELLRACAASAPVPVYGPAGEAIEHVTQRLAGGDVIDVGAPHARFSVLDVPGHTRGHIAYYSESVGANAPALFCGDTLFSCGCGRLFEGTPAQMLASLDAFAALPETTRVFCAHEYTLSNIRFALECDPHNADLRAFAIEAGAQRAADRPTLPSTIGVQKRVNPFLRIDDPALRRNLATHAGHPIENRVDAFANLRAWKDNFQ